jgi:hypothetical protein
MKKQPKTLSKRQAKKYSLIKWKYAKETGCDDISLNRWLEKEHSYIFVLYWSCGYCEKYWNKKEKNENLICIKCPLFKLWGQKCQSRTDPYARWHRAKTKKTRKKYAEIIYRDIKRS